MLQFFLLFISCSFSRQQPFTTILLLTGEFGGRFRDLVSNLGHEDEHLETSYSPGTTWAVWESWPESGCALCPLTYRD